MVFFKYKVILDQFICEFFVWFIMIVSRYQFCIVLCILMFVLILVLYISKVEDVSIVVILVWEENGSEIIRMSICDRMVQVLLVIRMDFNLL